MSTLFAILKIHHQVAKLTLITLGKISVDDILKYFSYFSQTTGSDISCKLSPVETICMKYQNLLSGKNVETICMKCQNLLSGKNKKNTIILSSAELAKRVVKVNLIKSDNQSFMKIITLQSL